MRLPPMRARDRRKSRPRAAYACASRFSTRAADPAGAAPAAVRAELSASVPGRGIPRTREGETAGATGGLDARRPGQGARGVRESCAAPCAVPSSDALRAAEGRSRAVVRRTSGRGGGIAGAAARSSRRPTTRFDRYKSRAGARAAPRAACSSFRRPASAATAWRAAAAMPGRSRRRCAGRATSATRRPTISAPSDLSRGRARCGAGARVCRARARQAARSRGSGWAALLGVSPGSAAPPRVPHRRVPAGARAERRLVLVGKGITFDSGGISIKPAASMGEMKYDMMGAATVFARPRGRARLEAAGPRRGARPGDREHARRHGAAARRHPPDAQRQDRRSRQHGRRGPARARRRALLRGEVPAGRPRGLRDADGRRSRRARPRVRGPHDRRRSLVARPRRRRARRRASGFGGCRSGTSIART